MKPRAMALIASLPIDAVTMKFVDHARLCRGPILFRFRGCMPSLDRLGALRLLIFTGARLREILDLRNLTS
jgi:hypothetical protein